MQATQSRRASGSWRRNGQFAALRYVSRHLEIGAGGDVGDSVGWERGSRWELLRALEDPSLIKGDAAGDVQSAGVGPALQCGAEHERAATGWIGC